MFNGWFSGGGDIFFFSRRPEIFAVAWQDVAGQGVSGGEGLESHTTIRHPPITTQTNTSKRQNA